MLFTQMQIINKNQVNKWETENQTWDKEEKNDEGKQDDEQKNVVAKYLRSNKWQSRKKWWRGEKDWRRRDKMKEEERKKCHKGTNRGKNYKR